MMAEKQLSALLKWLPPPHHIASGAPAYPQSDPAEEDGQRLKTYLAYLHFG
jgi:endo-1,4-beta-mannosidase